MKQKRKGFTLVELIVVIAIIGILAAVLIPTFSGAIESARKADDRLTVSNMNKTLTAYLAYHQIDAKDLDASEVQYIVSTEEEQYTFQPAFEGGVFWYNSNAGRIEYAETMGNPEGTIGGTAALADGPSDGPTSIEDVYGNGYLYLNAGGELATFLLNLRNLGSVQDYRNLKASVEALADGNGTLDGVPAANLQTICEKFDPAQTLYISSSGGFIDTASYTSNTYSNKPSYDGTTWTVPGGSTYVKVSYTYDEKTGWSGTRSETDTDTLPTGIEANQVSVGLASTFINQYNKLTAIGSAQDETGGDYWVIKINNAGGAIDFYEVKNETGWVHPEQNTIKNVVYATGLRVIPSLNIGMNIAMENDITLPATVYTVMQNAFTEVVSETRLVAKSQYAEVITGALGTNMTTSIAQKSVDSLMNNVETGNNQLKVYLVQHEVAQTAFIGIHTGYNSLATLKDQVEKGTIVLKNIDDISYKEKQSGDITGNRPDSDFYPQMICFSNTTSGSFVGKIDTTAYSTYQYKTDNSSTDKQTATENAGNDTIGFFLVGNQKSKTVTYEGDSTKTFTQPLYRLYLDTADLVKAFPTIHTIDVKYTPRFVTRVNQYYTTKYEDVSSVVEVYDITIQAFDNSGMCLNMVVTYEMA